MIEVLPAIQQYYFAWDLSHRKSTGDASKFTPILSEAKVDLNPHQVDAALFAFKSPLSKGAILADEVGLGKTIEAGLIISQFCAELKNRVLIIVPASLRSQWRLELYDKFGIKTSVLTTSIDAEDDICETVCICSYNYAYKYADTLSDYPWDLIVFDEAHKLRNVYKSNNVTAKALCHAFMPYKKILLTATPLQNNLKELYGLISIIDNQFFSSINTFDSQYNAVTTRDKAKYGELKSRLAMIIQRTLRSQVQEYVNYTRRSSFVQEYKWIDSEKKLYYGIDCLLNRSLLYSIPEKQRPLLSLVIRKIMASSSYALSFTLDRMINRLRENQEILISDLIQDYEVFEDDGVEDAHEKAYFTDVEQTFVEEIQELERLRDLAVSIGIESKANGLIKALEVGFAKMRQLGAPQKALIFTESRRSQTYLYDFLSKNGYEDRIVMFNGTNDGKAAKSIYQAWLKDPENSLRVTGNGALDRKQALVDYFREHAQIMIATEAGAEGINLQFCSLVVNYDLPWNPQRIEQRIGRCHRYGQKNDVIVVNFLNTDNYADCRVFQLLNDKLNLFDGVFGSSDEILGSLECGIDIERRLSDIYQNCRTELEIKAAFDLLQTELQELIEQRVKQTRKVLIENFDEEVIRKLKMRAADDIRLVESHNMHLWRLAKSVLADMIDCVDENCMSFRLNKTLGDDVPAGTYTLNKQLNGYNKLSASSELGKYIIDKALNTRIEDSYIVFSLTSNGLRVSALEPYIGKSGYMILYKIATKNRYDGSETMLPLCFTEDFLPLPIELGLKMLELSAEAYAEYHNICIDAGKVSDSLNKEVESWKSEIEEQTSIYVNYEIDKFEAWAEDNISPLTNELHDLSKEESLLKSKIRREKNASVRLELQEQLSTIKKKIKVKRSELYKLEDEYAEMVDKKTAELKDAMENSYSVTCVGKLLWQIV